MASLFCMPRGQKCRVKNVALKTIFLVWSLIWVVNLVKSWRVPCSSNLFFWAFLPYLYHLNAVKLFFSSFFFSWVSLFSFLYHAESNDTIPGSTKLSPLKKDPLDFCSPRRYWSVYFHRPAFREAQNCSRLGDNIVLPWMREFLQHVDKVKRGSKSETEFVD